MSNGEIYLLISVIIGAIATCYYARPEDGDAGAFPMGVIFSFAWPILLPWIMIRRKQGNPIWFFEVSVLSFYQKLVFKDVPYEYKWAAMESTGVWVAYPYKPILNKDSTKVGVWWHPEDYLDRDGIRGEFYYEKDPPPHPHGWEKSLIERVL